MQVTRRVRGILTVGLFLTIVSTAQAKYSGGTGEPNDPYQIATAADLIALGETPEDYDKHFILTGDIDLDPNLPGRKIFDRAVIAPDTGPNHQHSEFQGIPFAGVFDGDGHAISHLTIKGRGYVALFGRLGGWDTLAGEVKNLGVVDVNTIGSGTHVGGLVGLNLGAITTSYCSGSVSGGEYVGGLVGSNAGSIAMSCSTGLVSGTNLVGGLVGSNGGRGWVSIASSFSTCGVSGDDSVGGLVGLNSRKIVSSYSSGPVSGDNRVGGLVGDNSGSWFPRRAIITTSYSTGAVSGYWSVGGLVGCNGESNCNSVWDSVWDTESSGLSGSSGGVGLTKMEMMDPYMLGLNGFANDPNWVLDPGRDCPRLAWEGKPGHTISEPDIDWLEGEGTAENPYRINTANQLILLGKASILCDKHFVMGADIDLAPNLPDAGIFAQAVIPTFRGAFNGSGHAISHLTITGWDYVGLFGQLESGAEVENLGVVGANTTGSGDVGGLVGNNWGNVRRCYSSGAVSGYWSVGGLVGRNAGCVTQCFSSAAAAGEWGVGGLVGCNYMYGTGQACTGEVIDCYSTGPVAGRYCIGGLVGDGGGIATSYSCGSVSGTEHVGGLVGEGGAERVASFWDIQTSAQATSAGGMGKTTAEMQMAKTFLDAGWDFVGETVNGPNDIWKIAEGLDYPRLWWEPYDGRVTAVLGQIFTVTLESNPSTGYRWEWVDHQDSIVEQMGEAQFKPRETGDPPLVGAGGWESFDFKAVHPGQMTLKLVYRRPWEEGVEPLKTFSLQVTVP
ncbi:MAG: protease inhibitor I42 family protein [Phycisphaerales bacterium]